MKLEHMTGPEHPLYAAAWALYEAAFTANERRDPYFGCFRKF